MADHFCFLFKQTVKRVERQDQDTPPVSEDYVRTGLLLVQSDPGLSTWSRVLSEFLSDDAELSGWRERDDIPLVEMKSLHQERASRFQLPVGPEEQTELLSNPLNSDPVLSGTLVPLHGMPWLSVLPSLAGFEPKAGSTWTATVNLGYGFGAFKVPYRARVVGVAGTAANLEIDCEEKQSWAAGRQVVLFLNPAGKATMALNAVDRLPVRYEGKFSTVVRTDWRENNENRSLELSRNVCSFLYVRIPAAFTETTFLPVGWKRFGPPHL